MDTHLSTDEIKSYLTRTLTRNDFDRVGAHVHDCETCYHSFLGRLQERFPILIDLDELAGLQGWHLEGEELAAYLEGRMDELDFECASLHLDECGSCMEKTTAAFEYRLEYPRFKRSARHNKPIAWSGNIPGFTSISLPRLQFATAAALIIVLVLTLWTLMQSKSQNPRLAGGSPPEIVSPGPPPQQSRAPIQPDPEAHSDIAKTFDAPAPDQMSVTASSQKRDARRHEDEFARALIAKNLTMPPVIEMLDRTPSIAVRGKPVSSETFNLIGPLTTVISNDHPTFRWTALNGAESYIVSVFDRDLHLVRVSDPLTDRQWSIPDRLEAGVVYTWIVTALKDGQEITAPGSPARAEFRVLEKSELAEVNSLLTKARSHAARGVLYAETGLLDDAEFEFKVHLSKCSSDERVRKLFQKIKSWRGLDQ